MNRYALQYRYDELTGHRCIYNSVFAIGWLPSGSTHWIWDRPYFHCGLGRIQFCYIGE